MKLPRDISGDELIQILHRVGYQVVRQTGSHVRMQHWGKEYSHHITIPKHKSLRFGTLNGILQEVASHLGLTNQPIHKYTCQRFLKYFL